jgi:hypothetical protein
MTYILVTKPTVIAIISGGFSSPSAFMFPAPIQNLVGHKFKDDRDVETVVTRWLITQDTDGLIQEAVKKLVARYDEYLTCGGGCVEN